MEGFAAMTSGSTTFTLPWGTQSNPLLLTPMQGVTNRGLREVFGTTVRPDALFTEFVRVRPGSPTPVTNADFIEATTEVPDIPLVVQACEDLVVPGLADQPRSTHNSPGLRSPG